MLSYFLQYFAVFIRFHVIRRHRPFGSANSNKNVPAYLPRRHIHCAKNSLPAGNVQGYGRTYEGKVTS